MKQIMTLKSESLKVLTDKINKILVENWDKEIFDIKISSDHNGYIGIITYETEDPKPLLKEEKELVLTK